MTDLSLDGFTSAVRREFEHVAKGKGLDFSVEIAADCPTGVVSDPQRLRQIVTNLLANAFKFTEHGSVRMLVSLAEGGWNPGCAPLENAPSVVALSVTDTGIGIEADQQGRVFEAFAQGDGTTARLYGGTGLGLSISRELAGLLGGEIALVSEPGKGSTFTVYLPGGHTDPAAPFAVAVGVAPAAPEPPATDPPTWQLVDHTQTEQVAGPPKDGAFSGMKVLVVDDDFRNIFAMTALLERGDAHVTIADSGAEALAALERTPDIDIVLMDIMMPVMDGYSTIRAIRAIAQFASLPIVAVTGKVMPGERERCIAAGANDFIPKPVDTAELFAVLRPWLPATAKSPA
jgi:CheY-like chemotaxis protein